MASKGLSLFMCAGTASEQSSMAHRHAVRQVDYLVLSPGILTLAGRTETTEGNDRKLMLHYYARMAVINGLMDKLHSGSRVLSVLDSLRGNPSQLYWDDLDLKTHYSSRNAMMHAVTMTDISFQHLGTEHPDITFMHAYPGIVKTPIFKDLPWYARLGASAISTVLATSAETCADHLLQAFLAEDTKPYKVGDACFIDNKGHAVSGKSVATKEQQQKIWQHTLDLLHA